MQNEVIAYDKSSSIRRTQSKNLYVSRLVLHAVVFAQFIEARCEVENEDIHVVGAAPTGDDAPITPEWSAIVLPIKVRLIWEVWRYICYTVYIQVNFVTDQYCDGSLIHLNQSRVPYLRLQHNITT